MKMNPYDAIAKKVAGRVLEGRKVRSAWSDETDRGFVLIAVAYLEKRLEGMISDFFITGAKPKELFGISGFFGDLESKIKSLHLFGVIDDNMKKELGVLRSIHNKCAHVYSAIDLGEGDIGNEVKKLRYVSDTSLKGRARVEDSIFNLEFLISVVHSKREEVLEAHYAEPTPSRFLELRELLNETTDSLNDLIEIIHGIDK